MRQRRKPATMWTSFVSENPVHAKSQRLVEAWKVAQAAAMKASAARHDAWVAFFANPTTSNHRRAAAASRADQRLFDAQEAAWAAYMAHEEATR